MQNLDSLRMLWPRFIPSTLLMVVLLAPPVAAFGASELEEGLELFDALEYDDAIPVFESVLASEALEPKDRATAAVHLGIIHLAYGDIDRAKAKFVQALELNSSITPPSGASPHIIDLFEQAQAATDVSATQAPKPEKRPLMSHTEPEPGFGRTMLEIELDPARQVAVDRLTLRYRNEGESFWFDDQATAAGPNTFQVELPGPSLEVAAVEYYLEALDVEGQTVGQIGSAATPFSYRAPEQVAPAQDVEPARPIHATWWFWTGTGVAVAAGVLTTVVLLSSDDDPCGASDGRGCLRVEIQ